MLGIKHVRGVLLYGPPSTGKSLIANKIGSMVNASSIKRVSGPEILDKAEKDQKKSVFDTTSKAAHMNFRNGAQFGLHVIIFDELDAICRKRGVGGGSVNDFIVNQLLSKMEGLEQLHNVLVIGTTNRKDMIDEALLRPGRFEVHMKINVPDETGRLQIFEIHTAKMRACNRLDDDVDLPLLAKKTKNYSG
ncbi:hypothetical protein PENTCL1PPCAC_5190, partial [Pristionchus entomophagus]